MAWDFRRWLRHEFTGKLALDRVLPADALERIGTAVAASERRHGGEIRVAVEHSLHLPLFREGPSARARAIAVFSELRVWDTEANNGVLIYLLLADRRVEIVADRGIDRVVGTAGWERICESLREEFRRGRFEAGLLDAIEAVTAHLEAHFPHREDDRNELPDAPAIL